MHIQQGVYHNYKWVAPFFQFCTRWRWSLTAHRWLFCCDRILRGKGWALEESPMGLLLFSLHQEVAEVSQTSVTFRNLERTARKSKTNTFKQNKSKRFVALLNLAYFLRFENLSFFIQGTKPKSSKKHQDNTRQMLFHGLVSPLRIRMDLRERP